MKKIDFVFIGLPKDESYKALERSYHDKIRRYTGSELQYLKDSPEKNLVLKQKKESQSILGKIKAEDMVVLCDERGKSFVSTKFSENLRTWQENSQRIVFIIGGAFGVAEDLFTRANFILKLSDFTMPHELARVVLLEQVYRAQTILKGQKYHHE